MKLAENIQLLRRKNGLSQEELAEKCNISRQAVAKWENGESTPNIERVILLANLFNVTIDELVGRTGLDNYARFKEYVYTYKAEDIPQSSEDDISAIVTRYLLFVERMGLDASDRLQGLEEIFLSNVDV